MLYQNVFFALAAAAVVFTVLHVPAWHGEYRSYNSWRASGFTADSNESKSFRFYHNLETWLAVAIIICMGVNILLGQLIVAGVIHPHLPQPNLARYAIWTSGACFFVAYGTVNVYKRLMSRGCTGCSCARRAK
jgi:hypothetical protein